MIHAMAIPDRRRTARLRAYFPIRVSHPSGRGVVETLTKDVASGGIRFLSPVLFPVASEVRVDLLLSAGEEPVNAGARTIWFRTIPHSEQFDIGLAFHSLSPQNERRLSVYLSRLIEKFSLVPA